MKTTLSTPHFSGIYRFKSEPTREKTLLQSLPSTAERDQLSLKMKQRDPHATVSALLPYKGQVLGFSGQDALDLMKTCSDIYITTLHSIAKRLSDQVFNSPARPFDEGTVTRFLEAKSKTLADIEVIEV